MLAYVGPGAGFVLVASLAMLAAIGAAMLSLLVWPFCTLWRLIRGKRRDGAAISAVRQSHGSGGDR